MVSRYRLARCAALLLCSLAASLTLCCCVCLSARMNFLGLFTFTAPYLPWVLLAFSFVLGNNGVVDVVGIAVGHLYYFLEDVYPLMLPSRKRLLATPRLVQLLFNQPTDEQINLPNEQLPHIIHEEQLHQHIQLHDTQQQQQQGRQEEAAGLEADLPHNSAEEPVDNADEVEAHNESTGMRHRPVAAASDESVQLAPQ